MRQLTRYGKPLPSQYRFAEQMLLYEAKRLGVVQGGEDPYPLHTLYAIGVGSYA